MNTLTIYNTQTRKKEVFVPLDPKQVKMYVCGPTVYNLVHIGNARPVVVFDLLFRMLKTLFDEVIYARNITDIDDKIMAAAKENGESIDQLSQRFAQAYIEDMRKLNTLDPTIVPYATDNIDAMVGMVETLVQSGYAYAAEGHVLFDVRQMENYGELCRQSIDDMLEGARVEVAPYKRYGGDFVLWKPSNDDEPGWSSPWGRGRPGWHLECSAMIEKHLGETIDIHGGGRDLIFPHHENELAQSRCAHGGKDYVKYWMHNGYININGEKMSKSLGNFKTVRDLLKSFSGEVIRFALMSAQYRSELDFSTDLLEQSKASLDSLYCALRNSKSVGQEAVDLIKSKAYQALLDDLNTPVAISELHQLAKQLNKAEDHSNLALIKAELIAVANLMGLLQSEPEAWFQSAGVAGDKMEPVEIEALIAERVQAKKDRDYARADEIRLYLKEQGVALEDMRDGTSWRYTFVQN